MRNRQNCVHFLLLKYHLQDVMWRCDHLSLLNANSGKIVGLFEMLAALRGTTPGVDADQWQRSFGTGCFEKVIPAAVSRSLYYRVSTAVAGVPPVLITEPQYVVLNVSTG